MSGKHTRKGKDLFNELELSQHYRPEQFHGLVSSLSLICRHARTHLRLQEWSCNYGLSKDDERREDLIEERLRAIVEDMPTHDGWPWHVEFRGDPRGYTVRLYLPCTIRKYNTWGGIEEGWGV